MSTLSSSYIPLAWALDGVSLTMPTLSPSYVPFVWALGGNCVASPASFPSFYRPIYPLPGEEAGTAWHLPPFHHPFPLSSTAPYVVNSRESARLLSSLHQEQAFLHPSDQIKKRSSTIPCFSSLYIMCLLKHF